ncbi:MAG: glycosyltransferase [Parabacteroides sp.]|nr:glycosyltransferase [Parabacteroides sp.]
MENTDFIITSQQSWDTEIGSTIKNTAVEIARNNRVLYINTPLDHATWLRGEKNRIYRQRIDVIKKRVPNIRKIKDNFWVADCPFMVYSINKLPTSGLFDFFNKLNNKKIGRYILSVLHQLGFKNVVHLIDTDIYRSQYLKEIIRPAVSVYYCRDFVIGVDYWRKNGSRLEPLLAAKSDIVLANSTYFAERFKKYNPNTYPIETGVDLELYDASVKKECPGDMQSLPRPIIGYVGFVTGMRLDSDLLYDIARERPQYSFVFVGPEDELFAQHRLHTLKNVYFLGAKEVRELPDYIQHFNVCINPQLINDITIGNYPLKIDEYLAMGKPVVATSTHTMRDIFSEQVHLASGKAEYVPAIDRALTETDDAEKKEQRIRFAHSHSWTNSVNKIYRIIEAFQSGENKK